MSAKSVCHIVTQGYRQRERQRPARALTSTDFHLPARARKRKQHRSPAQACDLAPTTHPVALQRAPGYFLRIACRPRSINAAYTYPPLALRFAKTWGCRRSRSSSRDYALAIVISHRIHSKLRLRRGMTTSRARTLVCALTDGQMELQSRAHCLNSSIHSPAQLQPALGSTGALSYLHRIQSRLANSSA